MPLPSLKEIGDTIKLISANFHLSRHQYIVPVLVYADGVSEYDYGLRFLEESKTVITYGRLQNKKLTKLMYVLNPDYL